MKNRIGDKGVKKEQTHDEERFMYVDIGSVSSHKVKENEVLQMRL